MKKQLKQSRISIKSILCLSILIIGISAFSTVRVNATTVSYDPPSYSSLTPHDPIFITSDSGFAVFPGSGTVEDPYVIEGYDITTTDIWGIYIRDTTKHFIVRDCYIEAEYHSIYIMDVADGTVTIINNTCNNNDGSSILLWHSVSSTVTNNTCTNNDYGILLSSSGSSTVTNNTCTNNIHAGIYLMDSVSSTVTNNTCSNNPFGDGILLSYSGSSTVENNMCNNNQYGIYISSSDSSTVVKNTCSNNYYKGIQVSLSAFCVITYNLIQENEEYGVYVSFISDNNLIHHNTFIDNNLGGTSQAYDDDSSNYWYDSSINEGNYWSDWSGTGSYSIDGFVTSTFDLYPLDEPTVFLGPPVITDIIHSPSSPTELDDVRINATVTSPYGVQSVTLSYRVNVGTWIEVSMTLISGDLYSVTIGSFAANDTIEYYITTVDISIDHNEAIEDNSGLYYSFTIDYTDPAINDVVHYPFTPTYLDTVSINATVTDDSGIHNVTLHYKVNIGLWQTISMTLVSSDLYSVTIGSFVVGDTIEYFVSAIDNSSNHNEAINDNSGLFYSFTVSEVIPEFQTLSLLLPAITFLFLVCGLVVLQRRKK